MCSILGEIRFGVIEEIVWQKEREVKSKTGGLNGQEMLQAGANHKKLREAEILLSQGTTLAVIWKNIGMNTRA